MEWFKFVVIELRPKLQSANVFISLENPKKVTSVNLQSDLVQLGLEGSCCGKIDFPGFKAVPSSLASVKVTQSYVSFRFCTAQPSKLGSFKSELLKNPSPTPTFPKITVCTVQTEYSLNCTNCLNSLNCTTLKFDRVLPLPDSVDQSDWFCHSHTNHTLEPSVKDLFFSPCFVHINQLNIAGKTLTKNGVFVCKYCLNWLGIQHGSTTVKFWLNCANFTSSDSQESNKSTGLTDSFLAINNSFNKLLNTSKIIFFLKNSDGTADHLLLWIIEKQLDLVITDKNGRKETKVAKVLFRFIRNKNDDILQTWFEDQTVDLVDVSKNMMLEVLKHLYLHNDLFPDQFKKSNDFLISYLFMYE